MGPDRLDFEHSIFRMPVAPGLTPDATE